MRKNKKHYSVLFIAMVFVLANTQSNAQNPERLPVVADAAEVAKLRADVEANPEDLKKHQDYIKAAGGVNTPEVEKQYEAWMKQYPQSATVPFALGDAYCSKESPKARTFLLKAVDLNPKLAKAYSNLWIDAERWGDFNASRAYLKKAMEAEPTSPDYAFYYASSFSKTDEAKYRKLSLDVTKRFPESERGAQALYWLANRTLKPEEKLEYYEIARKDFPADKFNWSASSMSEYFDFLLERSPAKAKELAQSMLELKLKENQIKTWTNQVTVADNIVKANALLAEKKAQEAIDILAKTNVGRYSSAKVYVLLLKAEAAAATGNIKAAYDSLLSSYAKDPIDKVGDALKNYGSKLGKKIAEVNTDVLKVREAAAKQATEFTFDEYLKEGKISLADLRGKVVFITYWFPGCGPCRGEFPHFEDVVKKFKGKDLVYLGLNIVLDQDEYVVPFMKSSGYSFTPLRVDTAWKKGTLDNRNAAPVNFLLDKEGKIIFANFRTNESNERTLELMISSLLDGNAFQESKENKKKGF